MIYALVRGWLAGMAVLLIEILLSTFFLAPNFTSPLSNTFAPEPLSLALIAFLEESLKCLSLRGIARETMPFFRNAIFKGLLVGFGFALFETCIKILFSADNATSSSLVFGTISSTLLHIVTGGILGAAWFSHVRNRPVSIFLILFLFACIIHALYNILLAPILFGQFS